MIMAVQQGMNSQTPAVQNLLARAFGSGVRRVARRVKRKVKSAVKRKVKARASGKAARLVKGSAAAKRYMAKIRRLRKK
jgi:hypothetical protein